MDLDRQCGQTLGPLPRRRLLVILAAVNVASGVLSHLCVLYLVGARFTSDAFYAGQTIPSLFLGILGGGLARVLVPILESSGAQFREYLRGLMSAVAICFATVSVLLAVSAEVWVPWLVPGFDKETIVLTVSLTRIQCVSMVFMGISAVLVAAHQARLLLVRAELLCCASSVVVPIAVAALLPKYGIHAAAWVFAGRWAVQCAVLVPILGWVGGWRLSGGALRLIWTRLSPLLVGSAIFKLGPVIDRFLSSLAATGSLTLLNVGHQGYAALLQVSDRSLGASLLAEAARLANRGDLDALRTLYSRTFARAILGAVVVYVAVVPLGALVIAWAVGVSLLTSGQGNLLVTLVLLLGAFLVGGVAGQVSAGALYALGETGLVSRLSILSFLASTGLKIVGYYSWGIYGLALGIGSYQVLNAMLLHSAILREFKARHG